MLEAAALLARLDAAIRELLELRAEVAGAQSNPVRNSTVSNISFRDALIGRDNCPEESAADDLSEANLLDTHAAQERFGYPQDTIRKWCRTEGLGVMRGGRWLVSIPRLRQRLNGR